MTRKQKHLLKNIASINNTFFLALLFAVMTFFIMPDAIRQIKSYAHDVEIIDNLLFYSPDQMYEIIGAYSARGRKLYIAVELSADFFYSIIMALFLSSFLIWSSSKLNRHFIRFEYLIWIPALSVAANCLENAGIIFLLIAYPEKYFYLALVTSFFTFFKWLFITLSAGIAIWNSAQFLILKSSVFQTMKQEQTIKDQ